MTGEINAASRGRPRRARGDRAVSILVDGPDFAGKSTVCSLLRRELINRGLDTRHSVGGLTNLPDLLYRVLPSSNADRTAFSMPIIFLRDSMFLVTPIFDAAVRRWLWRRVRVVIQEGYYDRVLCHHQFRRHWLRVGWARIARRLVRFDLRVFLDVSYEESRDRYVASAAPNHRDDVRFGSSGSAHRQLIGFFRELAVGFDYEIIDTEQFGAHELARQLAGRIQERLASAHVRMNQDDDLSADRTGLDK